MKATQMGTLSDIRREVRQRSTQDKVRRAYLKKLGEYIKRDAVIYASNFSLRNPDIPSSAYSENDQNHQKLVLSAFHSTIVTLETTNCIKLLENHEGNGSFVQVQQSLFIPPLQGMRQKPPSNCFKVQA